MDAPRARALALTLTISYTLSRTGVGVMARACAKFLAGKNLALKSVSRA